MANDKNDEIPLTGDPRVDAALERIRGKFKDLEDAMIVTAYLEKKQTDQLIAHAEGLRELERERRRQARWWKRIRVQTSEMNGKIEFLLNREMHREGGPEAQQ